MQYSKALCKGCNSEKLIANKKFSLCIFCNQKRLGTKKRKPIKTKRKTTGEKMLFREIWNERLHICENCKVKLDNEARTFYFAHILPKSTHPELRLNKNNIKLLCYECHYAKDFQTKEKYISREKK